MKISAKLSEKTATKLGVSAAPVAVECNIPATLAEKVKLFGEDVVNATSEDSLIITVQALIRRMMAPKVDKAGKVLAPGSDAAAIQAAVSAWRPDVRTLVRQTAFEKASSSLDKLTPEERKALLAKLQALK